jgi:hypothetical protein
MWEAVNNAAVRRVSDFYVCYNVPNKRVNFCRLPARLQFPRSLPRALPQRPFDLV